MRGRIAGHRIRDGGVLGHGRVEQIRDGRGIMLPVLIHGDNPVAAGGGHPGQGRGMLPEVPAQPDAPDDINGRREGPDDGG